MPPTTLNSEEPLNDGGHAVRAGRCLARTRINRASQHSSVQEKGICSSEHLAPPRGCSVCNPQRRGQKFITGISDYHSTRT